MQGQPGLGSLCTAQGKGRNMIPRKAHVIPTKVHMASGGVHGKKGYFFLITSAYQTCACGVASTHRGTSFSICYCCLFTKSCQTLCDPVDCSTPGFPVLHYLPEFAQTHVHQVGDAIQPSHPLSSPSPPVFSESAQGLFPMSHFFASSGQSVGASASASVLPMNIPG